MDGHRNPFFNAAVLLVAHHRPVGAAADPSDLRQSGDVAALANSPSASPEGGPPVGDIIDWRWIFDGGERESLVAHCIGMAEGTRRLDKDEAGTYQFFFNSAYTSHTDPGNHVTNQGNFSYQHSASSAADADIKQFNRLKGQADIQENQAYRLGLVMTLHERLNGLDLANQSPVSGLGNPTPTRSRGYIKLLADARQLGLSDKDVYYPEGDVWLIGHGAIEWARVASYIDPVTNRWESIGLGATEFLTRRDQRRRMNQCDRAIRHWREVGKIPAGF